MKLTIVILCSFLLFASYSGALAQVSLADSARIKELSAELNTAAKNGDFAKAATISKMLIALGMQTSDIYFGAGMTLGLSGDKQGAIAYLDTAASRGFNDLTNWQAIIGMLGIGENPRIVKNTEIVKQNAEKNPKKNVQEVNPKLQEIYMADQKERTDLMGAGDLHHISQERGLQIYRNDSIRRVEVYTLLKENKLSTATDFSEAALILQHGNDTSDYRNAHELALASVKLGNNDAKWLAAATLDRYLVAQNRPQKYGTQSFTNKKTGKQELYPVDPTVTDEERAEWNCPPLKNALKAVEKVYDKK